MWQTCKLVSVLKASTHNWKLNRPELCGRPRKILQGSTTARRSVGDAEGSFQTVKLTPAWFGERDETRIPISRVRSRPRSLIRPFAKDCLNRGALRIIAAIHPPPSRWSASHSSYAGLISNSLAVMIKTMRISFSTSVYPMQLRGPCSKGRYAPVFCGGESSCPASTSHRSGRKSSGRTQKRGSLCA